jgi:hypothetical protein
MGAFEGERLHFEISVVTNQIFVSQSKVSEWCFCLESSKCSFQGCLNPEQRAFQRSLCPQKIMLLRAVSLIHYSLLLFVFLSFWVFVIVLFPLPLWFSCSSPFSFVFC